MGVVVRRSDGVRRKEERVERYSRSARLPYCRIMAPVPAGMLICWHAGTERGRKEGSGGTVRSLFG